MTLTDIATSYQPHKSVEMFAGLTSNEANDNYQFPKRQTWIKIAKSAQPQLDVSNRHKSLSHCDNSEQKDDVILIKVNNLSTQENTFAKNISKTSESRKLSFRKKANKTDENKRKKSKGNFL